MGEMKKMQCVLLLLQNANVHAACACVCVCVSMYWCIELEQCVCEVWQQCVHICAYSVLKQINALTTFCGMATNAIVTSRVGSSKTQKKKKIIQNKKTQQGFIICPAEGRVRSHIKTIYSTNTTANPTPAETSRNARKAYKKENSREKNNITQKGKRNKIKKKKVGKK